jgi:hypothetical protein
MMLLIIHPIFEYIAMDIFPLHSFVILLRVIAHPAAVKRSTVYKIIVLRSHIQWSTWPGERTSWAAQIRVLSGYGKMFRFDERVWLVVMP